MPTADANFSFPKSSRLKSSLLIKDIVRQHNAVLSFPIKCFYDIEKTDGQSMSKVAFLVSKKRFRHAVDRNRTKRLLREAYRLHCQELALPENISLNLCWMFVGGELPTLSQVDSASCQIFKELQPIINPTK
ncbi:MAG: ribonuclease P protein component [Bacteroidales bacterium]|nr:ribonuclease P protein component [Bacteroidales bacterium]